MACHPKTKRVTVKEKDFGEKCIELVLSEDKIGLCYSFKNPKENEIDDFKITYLGLIVSKKMDSLKLVNVLHYSGLYEDSRRANSALFIYDSKNKIIGHYYVGGAYDLPSKIEGSNLIFDYKNENCDQQTVISFADSIPGTIFVNCTKQGGDIHIFERE